MFCTARPAKHAGTRRNFVAGGMAGILSLGWVSKRRGNKGEMGPMVGGALTGNWKAERPLSSPFRARKPREGIQRRGAGAGTGE